MNEEQRRILEFCIGEWKSLAPLKEEIPYSTLYRIAKGLLRGRRLLLHRRKKGYRTTQRGIQALQKERTQVGTLEEKRPAEKMQPAEKKRPMPSKKPPVNLAIIQKLLGLSDKRVNFFLTLYPPLSKVPTPTHQAMIELCWAEVCDRKWPVTNDHHLTFANFADIFAWKTNSAKFCAHMAVGKDITPCIIDLAIEGGCSLWVRKTAGGTIIFKREILEGPFLCLDDYHRADSQAQKAAGHLLTGSIQIPLENQIQTIRCVSLVNLNPKKGATISDKTGFDRALIRRLIPCNLEAIELPDLKKIGEEALDVAKIFGRLKIEKPMSTCRQCREELIHYYKKLFTQEGQDLIDIDGLLNIARGFTGYGLTPSEAVRYVLYKASLPYHTLGWLRPEWVQGFGKEKSAAKIKKILIPRIETRKPQIPTPQNIELEQKLEKIAAKIRMEAEFRPKYQELMSLVEAKINILENPQSYDVWPFLLPQEKEKFRITLNLFNLVKKEFGKIEKDHWISLRAFAQTIRDIQKQHYFPFLKEISQKGLERQTKYTKLMALVQAKINELESLQNDEIWPSLLPEEKEKLITIFDTFKGLKEDFAKMKEGGWVNLEKYEDVFSDWEKRYDSLLMEICGKVLEREMIEMLKEVKDDPLTREDKWDTDRLNAGEKLDDFIANAPIFTEEQKRRIREHFPEAYKTHNKVRNTIQLVIKEHLASEQKQKNELDQNFVNDKIVTSHINGISPKKNKLGVSSKPKREPKTVIYPQKYYKEHPVEIIDQTEYRYTIRDASGKDISVPKSEVIFKNKES